MALARPQVTAMLRINCLVSTKNIFFWYLFDAKAKSRTGMSLSSGTQLLSPEGSFTLLTKAEASLRTTMRYGP